MELTVYNAIQSLSAKEILLLLYLNKNENAVKLGQRGLAEELRCDHSQIRKTIKSLLDKKLVRYTKNNVCVGNPAVLETDVRITLH